MIQYTCDSCGRCATAPMGRQFSQWMPGRWAIASINGKRVEVCSRVCFRSEVRKSDRPLCEWDIATDEANPDHWLAALPDEVAR